VTREEERVVCNTSRALSPEAFISGSFKLHYVNIVFIVQNNFLHVLIHAIAGDGSTHGTQLRERDE
jgi:hypothetical protein